MYIEMSIANPLDSATLQCKSLVTQNKANRRIKKKKRSKAVENGQDYVVIIGKEMSKQL